MNFSPGIVESPAAPPELNALPPRRTGVKWQGLTLILMSAAMLALALWLGWRILQQMKARDALLRDGQTVSGEISRIEKRGKSHVPWAIYTFSVNGTVYVGKAEIPNDLRSGTAPLESLSILYLPTNPEINHPSDWDWPELSNWWTHFPLVVLMLIGPFLFIAMFRERQLLVHGLPASAIVTGTSRAKNGYIARYEFRAQDGSMNAGRGWCETCPEDGAKIWIVYLPNSPTRSQPYPSANFRIAE